MIGLKPSHQSFPELDVLGILKNNNCKLQPLNLHSHGILKVVDKFGEIYSVLSLKLKVEWQNIYFKLYMEEKDTILDLKCLIFKATGLELSRQSFVNVGLSENLNDNDYVVQYLNLDTQFILKVEVKAETLSARKLKIQWENMYFTVDIASEDTILDIKSRIYTATDLQPTSQVFLNLCLPDNLQEESCLLEALNLEPGFLLRIGEQSQEQCLGSSSNAPIDFQQIILECNSIISLIAEHEQSCSHSTIAPVDGEEQPSSTIEKNNEKSTENQCKELSAPRPGKKLVVLDIDHTIIDYHASRPRWVPRPYLQVFLESIYEDYDIGIWSATEMKTALLKLSMLGMLTNRHYKILFCMSLETMSRVTVNRKSCRVKPLSNVWMRYPQYNSGNTVICDDHKSNFLLNNQNGIEVKPYLAKDHAFDNELLLLLRYLQRISQLKDLTGLNHGQWRKYKRYKDSAGCSSKNESGDIRCSEEQTESENDDQANDKSLK
ncbi:hypothetical protein ILUMI_11104 [Ignelater luminosus]|uniref:FCP1 homology domain-containing protein n=1 Tax=Ignelater luminosus TaxID=2038154 RepID=A0A8K0D5P8_IGNLU|nr:hypothetical protein ILUMI_11104 [Ignelater luminosus]